MFNKFIKHRPKQLVALYLEPHQVEVLRAHRQWRSWQVDAAERFAIPEGENPYDYLQRLNLRVKNPQSTALVLFLPHLYFSFHREHYPATLQDQLEEALTYDWPENLFYEHERTLHFSGTAVPLNHQLSVPVFSLQNDIFEKFNQALSGQFFQTFSIIPSALSYHAFLPSLLPAAEESAPLTLLARVVDRAHLEIHRFYKGLLLDSELIGRDPLHLKLFLERVKCTSEVDDQESLRINLVCTEQEHSASYAKEWIQHGLPLEIMQIDGALLSYWVNDLLQQDRIYSFHSPLLLKPIEIPKVTWVLALIVVLYSSFAFYQLNSYDQFRGKVQNLKQQKAQLEADWKPIERLQNRVAKFKQDQKTLSQFHSEGYPVLEMLNLLSQITPQDTWLNYLSLRRGQLLLRGESKSAIKYLTVLSQTGGFENVSFASPVTRNPASDMERFNINAELNLAKLNKAIGKSLPVQSVKSTVGQRVKESTVAPSKSPHKATLIDDNSTAVQKQSKEAAVAPSKPLGSKTPIDDNATTDNPTADKLVRR